MACHFGQALEIPVFVAAEDSVVISIKLSKFPFEDRLVEVAHRRIRRRYTKTIIFSNFSRSIGINCKPVSTFLGGWLRGFLIFGHEDSSQLVIDCRTVRKGAGCKGLVETKKHPRPDHDAKKYIKKVK